MQSSSKPHVRHVVRRNPKRTNVKAYVEVAQQQKGLCALCQEPSKHLAVDRFRKDGQVSLVCRNCFEFLRTVYKNPDRVIAYLENYR
jgi:hypothetical protein